MSKAILRILLICVFATMVLAQESEVEEQEEWVYKPRTPLWLRVSVPALMVCAISYTVLNIFEPFSKKGVDADAEKEPTRRG